MPRRKVQLPDYYPVGSKYIVEGRNNAEGQLVVSARYVVFPDGRRIDLPLAVVVAPPLSPRDVLVAKAPKPRRSVGRRTEHARREAKLARAAV